MTYNNSHIKEKKGAMNVNDERGTVGHASFSGSSWFQGEKFQPENIRNSDRTNPNKDLVVEMWEIIDTAGNLLLDKHHDYGPRNISDAPGGPLNGLRVRMWDKIARINNLIDNNVDPKNESLRDSFIDLINYSIISILVLDGTWPGTENK
jgi:hypothetical protein